MPDPRPPDGPPVRRVPSVTLALRERDASVPGPNPFRWAHPDSLDLLGRGRVAVFALPAAFSPTCSDHHLPAIDAAHDAMLEEGCDAVFATAVNDAFVLFQWARHLGLKRLRLLPDGNGDLARRMGMLVRRRAWGYGMRAWRHAFVADEGEIVAWFEEPGLADDPGTGADPYGETDPARVLDWLRTNPRPTE